jgi:hypothetical protein
MTDSIYTGGTTSQGPVVSATATSSISSAEFNYGINLPQYNNIPTVSGVYKGTLSAQGNMIAMALNSGNYNYQSTGMIDEAGNEIGFAIPWLTGYTREYWKNPSSCTFGSNSAIPALTGVMPTGLSMSGCTSYYIDLQLTRLSGSNYFDNFAFINVFNRAVSWVVNSNDYLLALKKAESNNLAYYGATSYQDFLTNGFSNYIIGNALTLALVNIGTYIQQVALGYFGTPNSIAKFLVDAGLGAYGSLTAQLTSEGIPIDDNIYNEIYTQQITAILKTINNINDLKIIQAVLGSTIPNIKNPLDYISINSASGIDNDSVFKTFTEFGIDLAKRSPNFNVKTGAELVAVINQVLSEASTSIENLATPTGILPESIINGLRTFLPVTKDNNPISILNVIGTPAGYLTDYLKLVNEGIDQLDNTAYGPQLRAAFTAIDKAYVEYNQAIINQFDDTGYQPPIPVAVIDKFEKTKTNYFALLTTISADPTTASIIQKINDNYYTMCELLSIEVENFNKGNILGTTYKDNEAIYSFVSGLPSNAADSLSIGTDYFLYNMCQDNDAGNIIKAILNQYKNNTVLSNVGVRVTNII